MIGEVNGLIILQYKKFKKNHLLIYSLFSLMKERNQIKTCELNSESGTIIQAAWVTITVDTRQIYGCSVVRDEYMYDCMGNREVLCGLVSFASAVVGERHKMHFYKVQHMGAVGLKH